MWWCSKIDKYEVYMSLISLICPTCPLITTLITISNGVIDVRGTNSPQQYLNTKVTLARAFTSFNNDLVELRQWLRDLEEQHFLRNNCRIAFAM